MVIQQTMSKFDLKTKIIVILGILLIIAVLFAYKGYKSDSDGVIKDLHEKMLTYEKANAELEKANIKLDSAISVIKVEIKANEAKLEKTNIKLQELNKKRDEISTSVNHLSASGVADEFTKYLDERTKGANNR